MPPHPEIPAQVSRVTTEGVRKRRTARAVGVRQDGMEPIAKVSVFLRSSAHDNTSIYFTQHHDCDSLIGDSVAA